MGRCTETAGAGGARWRSAGWKDCSAGTSPGDSPARQRPQVVKVVPRRPPLAPRPAGSGHGAVGQAPSWASPRHSTPDTPAVFVRPAVPIDGVLRVAPKERINDLGCPRQVALTAFVGCL